LLLIAKTAAKRKRIILGGDVLDMKTQFRLAIGLLLIIIFVAIGTFVRLWNLQVIIGPFFLHHWFSLIGGAYLLTFIAIYAYLKRHTAVNRGTLLKVHVFGNLLAVMLVSVHFAVQMSRPAQFAPDLGTGLATYLLFMVIVAAGFMMRFGLAVKHRESWHLIHVGLSLSLFIVLVIHTLRNLGIL
jgi:hypothetical protein